MRSLTSRKLDTEEELYGAALRALMRRAHSVHEMRELLERRAGEASLVRPVLDRLKQRGYLDDPRYAREFARARAQTRHQGRYRIARELRARGVPDRHIETALNEVFAETDEAALIRARLRRRLARLGGSAEKIDEKKLASLYRSLLRSGFSSDAIRNELRTLILPDQPDMDETPTTDED